MDPQLSAVGIILYVEPEKVNDAVAFYKAAFDAVEANDPYFAAQVIIGGTIYLIEYHEDPSDLWVWFSCFKFSLYFVSLSFGGLLEEKWLKLDLIMFFFLCLFDLRPVCSCGFLFVWFLWNFLCLIGGVYFNNHKHMKICFYSYHLIKNKNNQSIVAYIFRNRGIGP